MASSRPSMHAAFKGHQIFSDNRRSFGRSVGQPGPFDGLSGADRGLARNPTGPRRLLFPLSDQTTTFAFIAE